jgi:hypothetical protein
MKDVKEKAKKLFVRINTPTDDIFQMSVFEYSRWLTLMDAVVIIDRGANRLKIDLDSSQVDWIQPIAIEKYIRNRYEDILNDLMQDSEFLKETTCISLPEVNLQ